MSACFSMHNFTLFNLFTFQTKFINHMTST